MKKCSACKKEKQENEFAIKKKNRAGENIYQSFCKECNKQYQKEHYKKNKERYKNKAREWEKKYKKDTYKALLEHTKSGCSYCEEKDFRCLQFNHIVREEKTESISKMITDGKNKNLILEELKKCEVVCCNCHFKITSDQFGWYKFLKD